MHGISMAASMALAFDPRKMMRGADNFESAALKQAKDENARIKKEIDAKAPISGYTPVSKTPKQIEAKKEDKERVDENDKLKHQMFGFDPMSHDGGLKGAGARHEAERQAQDTDNANRARAKTAYADDTISRERQSSITHERAEQAYKEHMSQEADRQVDAGEA